MKSTLIKQVFQSSRRGFSASLYNYSSSSNPQVYLSVSSDGQQLGNLVFELYSNKNPLNAENFKQLCQTSLVGTSFTSGAPGIAVRGGVSEQENVGAEGVRLPDEDTTVRHYKRGILSMANDGENANGREFYITLGKADLLDGYHTVVGELVQGEETLAEIERNLSRLGNIEKEIKIDAAGSQ